MSYRSENSVLITITLDTVFFIGCMTVCELRNNKLVIAPKDYLSQNVPLHEENH